MFLVVWSAPGAQERAAQTAVKTSGQADREAAENLICEGLKVIQAKIGQLERSVSSGTRLYGDLKAIDGRIKDAKLRPLPEQGAPTTAQSVQVRTDLVPLQETRTITQLTGRIQSIKDGTLKIGGAFQAQIAGYSYSPLSSAALMEPIKTSP